MIEEYKVYIKVDQNGRIAAINSNAFLSSIDEWIEIDSGYGDKYHHAQGNYFDKPIYDVRGICRYKLANGVPVERTQAEMDADWEPPIPVPDQTARIEALEAAMHAIEEGIASV